MIYSMDMETQHSEADDMKLLSVSRPSRADEPKDTKSGNINLQMPQPLDVNTKAVVPYQGL